MLRLTRTDAAGQTTLTLEGCLAGDAIDVLERECATAAAPGVVLTLNLGAVDFVDAEGLATLQRLRAEGLQLDARLFIRELLATGSATP